MIDANAGAIETAFIVFAICVVSLAPVVLLALIYFTIRRRFKRQVLNRSFFDVIRRADTLAGFNMLYLVTAGALAVLDDVTSGGRGQTGGGSNDDISVHHWDRGPYRRMR